MNKALIQTINDLIDAYGSDDGGGPIPIIEQAKTAIAEAERDFNHQFVNRIKSLYAIDRYMLPELTREQWNDFSLDPPRYLRSTDKNQTTAIMREVEKRQTP